MEPLGLQQWIVPQDRSPDMALGACAVLEAAGRPVAFGALPELGLAPARVAVCHVLSRDCRGFFAS